ncbi:hypothetical protein [Geodermatophilus sabuli]|uniref:ATP synthase F0 subunit B n=1 Tax=Geodermatophilus sabuli TaxID=1564158 RepID=A0A285E614_9ACTN|nr:hypothetical protein [Geodermatophilus sabuli]MBB3082822.1 hypothetical protein [Geodermatophilus sabuli]SNX94313.1 hypothetical protein SAMN06893097_101103 [Geodermatophilus sabuli]
MTHSIDTPFPPPPSTPSSGATGTSTTATGSTTTGTTGSPSTTDVAKGEARNVGQTAAQAGSQVASTAADQAKEIAYETKQQARDLAQQGRTQLRQQAVASQQKAAQGLQGIAAQLRGMVEGNGAQAGPARDLVEQATGKVEEFAGWLQNREPADLLEEVRSFARRKPGTFLLSAALAGVVAGRLTSGVKAAHSDTGTVAGQHRATPVGYTQTNYVDPTPAYSGYSETTGYETTTGYGETAGYSGTGTTGTAPVPPPPYGTVPPADAAVPPTTPAGWDDPARNPGRGV